MTASVALVTARAALDDDVDLPLAVAALDGVGRTAEVVRWDDPAVSWDRFGLAVVYSTWDYLDRRDEFLAWADRVAAVTTLANPAEVLRWNTDKRYLQELERAGVPVVPTRYLAPGDVVGDVGWSDVVVKPTISAGSRFTGRFRHEPDRAAAFARRLLDDGRDVMLQPYLAAVDVEGELSVCVFGGRPSHVLRKHALLRPGMVPVADHSLAGSQEVTVAALADAPLELVDRVLAAVPGPVGGLLYARIDCATAPDGSPVLMEAELTEPHFFLTLCPPAAHRFAAAVDAWLP